MGYKDIYIKLLERLEGFSPYPYKDHHQWSIGYGQYAGNLVDKNGNSLLPTIKSITKPDALVSLAKLANTFDLKYIIPNLKVVASDGQHAALVSMAYNLPKLALVVVAMMNRKYSPDAIHGIMKQYVHAGGVVNKNLVARREIEFSCFQTGTW